MTDYIPPHVLDQPAPRFDLERVQTPAYVVDTGLLKQNLEKLAMVQREAGCKVLLAQKGFSMWSTYPIVSQYLSGCCASGLHEALLAHEEFGKEVHVYAPFFTEAEMKQIIPIACHISFNSLTQWRKWRPVLDAARAAGHAPSPGIRVNPEHSEVEVALYDPCSPGCRLGIRQQTLEDEDLSGLEGLHFHALCEQDSDVLERTLEAVEKRFPKLLEQVQWVNMGGGHHITRKDYDVERLIRVVRSFRQRWGKDVYLEPGEAIGLNTGYLIASVMDIVGERSLPARPARAKIQKHEPAPDSRTHPTAGRTRADALGASAALRARLQDVAGRSRGSNAAERINSEAESIRQWAEENGWLIDSATLADWSRNASEVEGASEHDVFLPEGSDRIVKSTRPPNFGARGEALAYLNNIHAANVLFGDDWRLEGVHIGDDGLRIITSQPFIKGTRASEDQIAGYFSALGFHPKGLHRFARADGVAVADARPDNVLIDAEGTIYPIDIHVLVPDGAELDGSDNDIPLPTAILDISATAHMPDTLEMPYRPHIIGAGFPGEHPHVYRLGGPTCLAGDVVNDYSFPEPLKIGQKLVFTDQAHYTMVKTTTFNGVPHPDIDIYDPETDELKVVRRFGYEDFKRKLS